MQASVLPAAPASLLNTQLGMQALLPSAASESSSKHGTSCQDEQLIEAVHAKRLQRLNEPRARVPEAIIDRLPAELLTMIGGLLEEAQLATLAQVSKRFRSLADDDEHWEKLWRRRWGAAAAGTAVVQRAAQLAGGWKLLFRSKALQDGASAPWIRACTHEVEAMIAEMVQHAGSGPGGVPGGAVFLLDGSGSVTEEDFVTMTGFAKQAINSLRRAHPECKAGLVQFSNGACVELPLGIHKQEAVEDCISGMARMAGGTCIAEAIRVGGQLLQSAVAPQGAHVIVLLTDGRVDHYQGREAVHMAQRVSDEQLHAALFALGVGRGVDRDELDSIIEACGGSNACDRYLALAVHPHSVW